MRGVLVRFFQDLVPQAGDARKLALLTFVQSLGTGLFLTSSAIFFTKVIGFSPHSVAAILSVAGFFGFLSTVPAGKLADRFGPRRLLSANYAALAMLFILYCTSDSFAVFAVVACLIAVGETAGSPLRAALTFNLFGKESAAKVRAQMRSIFNLGSMAGAALAAVALASGTHGAFYVVILANAASQLLCAAVTLGLRECVGAAASSATPEKPRRHISALRDYRFVLVTLASGLLEMHNAMLNIGIPLWITFRLHESGSVNSAVMILNTLLVLLFQVKLSKDADSLRGASMLQKRSGIFLFVSCILFAGTLSVPGWLIIPLVIFASIVMAFGEMCQAAGSWGISFELPPPGRQGEYQGVFALGRGLQQFLGPVLVTTLVISLGSAGWVALGLIFAAVGLLSVPLVRAAESFTLHPPIRS